MAWLIPSFLFTAAVLFLCLSFNSQDNVEAWLRFAASVALMVLSLFCAMTIVIIGIGS